MGTCKGSSGVMYGFMCGVIWGHVWGHVWGHQPNSPDWVKFFELFLVYSVKKCTTKFLSKSTPKVTELRFIGLSLLKYFQFVWLKYVHMVHTKLKQYIIEVYS